MEQSWMMGMELERSWIIAGGVGIVLLIALVWFLARRRSKGNGAETEASPDGEIRLTEPTLEPLPEVSEGPETEATDDEASRETADEAPPTETPEPESKSESKPDPDHGSGTAPEPEPEQKPQPDTEPEPEPEPEHESEPVAESLPEESGEAPVQADAAEAPPVSDPVFLAAREAFERELLAGNFSRLDVFEAYARAQERPDAPGVPRSEFFHRVVNQALETRDAFEALLLAQDREQFVDIHSRYLDDVTDEADADVRERLHHEHQEKLVSLRPRPAESA